MRLIPPSPVCDDAEFSADGLERLWLSRKVERQVGAPLNGHVGLIIGLNPSTAGAAENDATIRKEIEFARRWGWSGFWKANLFTHIETDSTKLKKMSYLEACGSHGSDVLEALIPVAAEIVVCWGASVPKHMTHRIPAVCARLRVLRQPAAKVLCFGLSKGGHPVHPLYLSYETELIPFDLPATRSRRDD